MKKLFLLFLTLTSSLLTLKAQTYYTRASGSWADNTNVWSTVSQSGAACACSPGNSVSGSTVVYVYNNVSSFGALTSLAGSGKIVIETGDSAVITTSTLSLAGSSNITVSSGAVLIINGALNMSGSTTISNNGVMVVYGNISNSGSATVTDNGDLTVHGNVTTTGSASFNGTGTSYVVGKVSGSGTSMLSVLPSFFSSFSSATGTGLIQYQTSPILSFTPLQFNGNSNTVLTGNGTFANFSAVSPWVQSGSNIYYSAGNVGIGTSGPILYPLVVQGTAVINGNLAANNIAAANNISVGTFRIVNGVIDSFVSSATQMQMVANNLAVSNSLSAGTTLTAGGSTGPLAVKIDGTNATITSPSGNVGFGSNNITTTGTINAGNFNVTKLTVADSIKAPVIQANRIALMPGDSLIHIGDSSIVMDIHNNIYGTSGPVCSTPFTHPSFTGIALGFGNNVTGSRSCTNITCIAVGTTNTVNQGIVIGTKSNIPNSGGLMVIGSGLTNNVPNSIMIGNSSTNKPAITLIPDLTGSTPGNIGIGTNTPDAILDIEQASTASKTGLIVQAPPVNYAYGIQSMVNPSYPNVKAITVSSASADYFTVSGNGDAYFAGNVGINNASPGYPLDVSGTIHGWEVKVCVVPHCDFVFDQNYNLMNLDTLNTYLKCNHHLPGIASAKEMADEGSLSLGKMDSQLLQKVEELTLYVLQQQKQIKELQAKVEELSKK